MKKLLISTLVLSILPAVQAKTLNIAVQKIPDTLDPFQDVSNINQRTIYNLCETLIKPDFHNGSVLNPGLASSWKVLDAKTIQFTLRDGILFHDGSPLTAEVVAWNFSPERLTLEQKGNIPVTSLASQFFDNIQKAEALDSHTVQITMKTPDALIEQRFANYPSQIVSKQSADNAKDWKEFGQSLACTGPYKIGQYQLGDKLEIVSYSDYWGNPAPVDNVIFKQVSEPSTRIAGLQSGQFDFITEVSTDNFPEIISGGNQVVGGPIMNIRGLIYAANKLVLQDKRIRQALNLAIDREAIVQGLYESKTAVPNGWQMDVFGDMYLNDRGKPEYNPEKAISLLKEAGYDGEVITYRIMNGYYTNQVETARILVGMWNKVGLNVKIEVKENWDQILEDNDQLNIFDGSFSAYYPDPASQFWRRFGPNGSWYQRKMYSIDSEMRSLGDVLNSDIDTAKRRDAFRKMLDMFDDNPYGTVLHNLTQFYGISKNIDYNPMPTEYLDLTSDSLKVK